MGQLGSATKLCERGGKQEQPSAPPLADLVLGMLRFASVYIPSQQNDSVQGLGRVTAPTANMCLLEKVFFHWFGRERTEESTHEGLSAA